MFGVFQKAGANLLDLINDILDLSKVESGHVELESIGFDLGAVLQKIIEMMASRAQDRGLRLTLEILPDVPSGTGRGSESSAADSHQSDWKRAEIH